MIVALDGSVRGDDDMELVRFRECQPCPFPPFSFLFYFLYFPNAKGGWGLKKSKTRTYYCRVLIGGSMPR